MQHMFFVFCKTISNSFLFPTTPPLVGSGTGGAGGKAGWPAWAGLGRFCDPRAFQALFQNYPGSIQEILLAGMTRLAGVVGLGGLGGLARLGWACLALVGRQGWARLG